MRGGVGKVVRTLVAGEARVTRDPNRTEGDMIGNTVTNIAGSFNEGSVFLRLTSTVKNITGINTIS